jgi:Tfp pilus assembly protein PilF
MNKKNTPLVFLLIPLAMYLMSCTPTLQKSQLNFGIKAAQKDLWEEAIFRWKKVIQNNPSSASAHNNLAVAYEKKGWLEEAEKEYQTALELNPGNEHIQANYNNFKKNIELFKKAEEEKNEKKQ